MRSQWPAMASSTELSTTSQTRWWRPVMPGAADVHAGALADVREPLEDRHGRGGVGLGLGRHRAAFQECRREVFGGPPRR